jgi:hypothetical protein
MKPETRFRQGRVIPFLKTLKNTKYFSVQQVAISGTPDQLLCCAGTFVALELKAIDGVLSGLQRYNLQQVRRCGGVAIVADPNNWPKVKQILRALDEGDELYEDYLRALEQ